MTQTNQEKGKEEASHLKALLEGRKINQQDLAAAMQTSRVAVNQIMNGKRGITPVMALKLEAALGIPANRLLERQTIFDLDRAYRENKDVIEEIRNRPLTEQ
jgi:addiction module HigA family antidote